MLPIPSSGISRLELPTLPPSPSGPVPTGPKSFNSMYDNLWTAAEQVRGLPTQMEVAPLIMPATSLTEPYKPSVEFPQAVDPDGLHMPGKVQAPSAGEAAFSGLLSPFKDGLNEVNRLQAKAKGLAEEAAVGGDVDLHDVMIAGEKASVAMQLTLQIRNKMVEAYQEVMRMQV